MLAKIILQPCERRLISIKRQRCFAVAVLPNLNTLAKFPFCFSSLTAFSLFSKTNCLLALTNIYIRRLKQFSPLLFVGGLYIQLVCHITVFSHNKTKRYFLEWGGKHLIWKVCPLGWVKKAPSSGEAEELMGNKCVWMEALRGSDSIGSSKILTRLRFTLKTKCLASLILTCKSPPLSISQFQLKQPPMPQSLASFPYFAGRYQRKGGSTAVSLTVTSIDKEEIWRSRL